MVAVRGGVCVEKWGQKGGGQRMQVRKEGGVHGGRPVFVYVSRRAAAAAVLQSRCHGRLVCRSGRMWRGAGGKLLLLLLP